MTTASSLSRTNWNSRKVVASKERPGVEFVIARMTFGRRIELMREVREGLEEIRGLELDGVPATAESLIESGPEELFLEALTAVKAECGLLENERKN